MFGFRLSFFSLFFCCLCGIAFSQTVTVLDQSNRAPLEAVTLASNEPKAMSITGEKGQANLNKLKGASAISIQLIGYKTKQLSFAQIEKAGFVVLLSPSSFTYDGVVVSASRWKQSKREIPMKISGISPKDVALQQPQTTADLLGSSGEVFIQKSQQGGGSPMIRGFATNRLLIAVDGVRMNNPIFRSGNLQNVISLDPFALENTEVLFGPSSVIYGSDAIGGVMSFQTLTPQLSKDSFLISGNVNARYSTANNEMTEHVDLQFGWEKWALLSSFSHFDYGDLRMGMIGPDDYLQDWYVQRVDTSDLIFVNDDPRRQIPSGYSQNNFMQKVRFAPNEKWDLQYGFHYSATGDFSRYDRLTLLENGQPKSAEWYYGPQLWSMHHLNIFHQDTSALYDEFTIRLAHQRFEESRIDRDLGDVTRRRRVEKVDALSVNFDISKSVGKKHKVFYGLETVVDEVTSVGSEENILSSTTTPAAPRYPNANWNSYAAYLSYQYKASESFILLAGARYNQFTIDATFDTAFYPFSFQTAELNNGALTGSLGFAFNPNEKWSFGAGASSGFRAPNVDDIGKVFDSEPGTVVVPNPDLKAEHAYNFEADIAKIFGEFMKVDVVAYYTILQDAMVRRDFTLNGSDSILYDGAMSKVQAIQNAASATVYGVQAGIEINLPGAFAFNSRFNYQKGEEELSDGSKSPMRHAGPWFGASHLTYNVNKFKLDIYTVYTGAVLNVNLAEEEKGKAYLYAQNEFGMPYAPAWYTLNFKAQVQATPLLTINCGVENITDQRYRPYSSGLAAPGRNFILAVRASF